MELHSSLVAFSDGSAAAGAEAGGGREGLPAMLVDAGAGAGGWTKLRQLLPEQHRRDADARPTGNGIELPDQRVDSADQRAHVRRGRRRCQVRLEVLNP